MLVVQTGPFVNTTDMTPRALKECSMKAETRARVYAHSGCPNCDIMEETEGEICNANGEKCTIWISFHVISETTSRRGGKISSALGQAKYCECVGNMFEVRMCGARYSLVSSYFGKMRGSKQNLAKHIIQEANSAQLVLRLKFDVYWQCSSIVSTFVRPGCSPIPAIFTFCHLYVKKIEIVRIVKSTGWYWLLGN